MRPRHAVALTAPEADPRLLPATFLESTLVGMLQVLILSNLNLFKMNTFTARPRFAQSWCTANPLDATLVGTLVCVANKGLREIVSPLDATLTKNRGRGPHDHQSTPLPSLAGYCEPAWSSLPTLPFPFNCRVSTSCVPLFHGSRNTDHESRPRYLLTSLPLAALPAPPATLFHPWLANASANISSPISTGAKRSRAPSAFHRTPPCRSRTTINIAGSKSVQDTVK